MDKAEWIKRCAAQYVKRAAMTQDEATAAAEASLDNLNDDLTENPEDSADEDISCWGD